MKPDRRAGDPGWTGVVPVGELSAFSTLALADSGQRLSAPSMETPESPLQKAILTDGRTDSSWHLGPTETSMA